MAIFYHIGDRNDNNHTQFTPSRRWLRRCSLALAVFPAARFSSGLQPLSRGVSGSAEAAPGDPRRLLSCGWDKYSRETTEWVVSLTLSV